MRKFFVLFIILVLTLLYLLFTYSDRSLSPLAFFGGGGTTIYLEDTALQVEVYTTDEERSIGLSQHDSLGSNEGALFIFDESDFHGIWMRGMRFHIDILWVDENFRIVDIEEDVSPSTFPRVFEPRVPARFVIETNPYYASSFGVGIGDMVDIPREYIPEDLR